MTRSSRSHFSYYLFFFNDTATTEIYTLSLHDALPIFAQDSVPAPRRRDGHRAAQETSFETRSEEHTSELQSRRDLVCRLLLEKKKKKKHHRNILHYQLHSHRYIIHQTRTRTPSNTTHH